MNIENEKYLNYIDHDERLFLNCWFKFKKNLCKVKLQGGPDLINWWTVSVVSV